MRTKEPAEGLAGALVCEVIPAAQLTVVKAAALSSCVGCGITNE